MQRTVRIKERGVTLVELITVITVLSIIIPAISAFLISSYKDAYQTNDRVRATSQAAQALQDMEYNVRTSSGFLATVPVPFSDNYGPHSLGTDGDQAWSYKGDSATSRALIFYSYSTSSGALDNARRPVFRADGKYNCEELRYYQAKLQFVTIFFVRNGNLYRRVLTDTTSPLCPGEAQAQKQSCPPEVPLASRPASCRASDEIIASNVTDFNITYYSDSFTTPEDVYSIEHPELANYAHINVSLTISNQSGRSLVTMNQRMTRIN